MWNIKKKKNFLRKELCYNKGYEMGCLKDISNLNQMFAARQI